MAGERVKLRFPADLSGFGLALTTNLFGAFID
jgi:hypothetical protein